MKEISGTGNRILEVDLTMQNHSVGEIDPHDRDLYLGGKGLGLKLFYDRVSAGIDPLGGENILLILPGILMGTGAPCSGRFAAVTKSPLTGIMASASCGGPFGMSLKTAGWDVLLVKGKAKSPLCLFIDAAGAEFRPAGDLWGLDTSSTIRALGDRGETSLVIGPAGENQVRYANIRSGHRFLGRGGMGAVMGSKNLKAIVCRGKEYSIEPRDKKRFEKARKKLNRYINRNSTTAFSYRRYGTNVSVNLNNASGMLPVNNFTGGSHTEADRVSGETMAERFRTKYSTCRPCTILCGHKGTVKGAEHQIPEYETIGLFGPNLGIFDPEAVVEWNDICTEMGMDTISAAGTLAWVMEAAEKGLLKSGLKFGSPEGISETLLRIGRGAGEGKEFGLGSRKLAQMYGGMEFAIQTKGMEFPAYDPRAAFGQGLSYAVANRGACHLSTYLLSLEQYFNLASPYALRGKHRMVKFFENVFSALNSLHICQFTSFAVMLEPPLIRFTPGPLLKLMLQNMTPLALSLMDVSLWPELWHAVMGKPYIPLVSMLRYLKTGERIHVLERYMNTREGISRKDDILPERFLKEGRECDPQGRTIPLEKMLGRYYRARGYDENGVPRKATLKKLGIVPK